MSQDIHQMSAAVQEDKAQIQIQIQLVESMAHQRGCVTPATRCRLHLTAFDFHAAKILLSHAHLILKIPS